jgi:hypothetical protein
MLAFVELLRAAYPHTKIVLVADVVQEKAVERTALGKGLDENAKMWLVASRVDGNKFVGKGKTITGDRCLGRHIWSE